MDYDLLISINKMLNFFIVVTITILILSKLLNVKSYVSGNKEYIGFTENNFNKNLKDVYSQEEFFNIIDKYTLSNKNKTKLNNANYIHDDFFNNRIIENEYLNSDQIDIINKEFISEFELNIDKEISNTNNEKDDFREKEISEKCNKSNSFNENISMEDVKLSDLNDKIDINTCQNFNEQINITKNHNTNTVYNLIRKVKDLKSRVDKIYESEYIQNDIVFFDFIKRIHKVTEKENNKSVESYSDFNYIDTLSDDDLLINVRNIMNELDIDV